MLLLAGVSFLYYHRDGMDTHTYFCRGVRDEGVRSTLSTELMSGGSGMNIVSDTHVFCKP